MFTEEKMAFCITQEYIIRQKTKAIQTMRAQHLILILYYHPY